MAGRGETVKYVIDADVSSFIRGLVEADVASKAAGKNIEKSLSKTAKSSENNFTDIRRNASQAASQIRNFGVALQAFNTTSLILGVTALTGAVIELSGAIAAAGSTALILVPALTQMTAGTLAFKSGVSGLDDAFKALASNSGDKFAEALKGLSPAGQAFARSAGAINNAFKAIGLNTQQKLLAGLSDTLLNLGGTVLPTVNAGFQLIGQSLNGLFKNLAQVGSSPVFSGLLATIFQDTARNITTLSAAAAPLLTIFTNLYLITRPYVDLLARGAVNLTNITAAYLSSAKGQFALTNAINFGIIAIKEIGQLVVSVFGLLTDLFRTSIAAGESLIPTLTNIITRMREWVQSAEGQAKLTALFRFTAIVLNTVAEAAGKFLSGFLGIVQIFDSLNPAVQKVITYFLIFVLAVVPVVNYLTGLSTAIKTVGVTMFNLVEQALVMFRTLGLLASGVLFLGIGLITLGFIIKGPLGGALIFVGVLVTTFIVLNFLLARSAAATAAALAAQAAAGVAAGAGLTFAARAATLLQASLLPLLALATGLFVILSLLGVFSNKAKGAGAATSGFSSSLGGLQKSLKGVGATGGKAADGGLTALQDSLNGITDSSDQATTSLAGFDKMNVLTENSASGAGVTGLPALPDLGGGVGGLGAPSLDTADFDKNLEDMQKNFAKLAKQISTPFKNPFQALADWINTHPWVMLGILAGVVAVIGGVFVAFGVAAVAAVIGVSATIGLIVLAVAAVIGIIIILVKNWDTVWAAIKKGASLTWQFLQNIWDSILGAATLMLQLLLIPWQLTWEAIKAIWGLALEFFKGIFEGIRLLLETYINIYVALFQLAWDGVKFIWNAAVGFFQAVVSGIQGAFGAIGGFFANTFNNAWNLVKSAFGGVAGFFQGVWNTIVGIFSSVGTVIGDAVGSAFKSVVNTAINWITDMINTVIRAINSAISIINKIPRVNISSISTISLPRLAKGGIVNGSTIAELGENGAEAVMPLENNTEWIDKLAKKINGSGNTGSANSDPDIIPVTNKKDVPSQNITIQVSGVFATSVAEQKKVADLIAKQLNASLKSKGLKAAF